MGAATFVAGRNKLMLRKMRYSAGGLRGKASFQLPVDKPQVKGFLWLSHTILMSKDKLDLLPGSLDLLVLQTLSTLGRVHGYGIARRIELIGADSLLLNQGTIYAALVRLQQSKLIEAEWGVSDKNRKAKFYQLTDRGRRRLVSETDNWQRVSNVVERILRAKDATA